MESLQIVAENSERRSHARSEDSSSSPRRRRGTTFSEEYSEDPLVGVKSNPAQPASSAVPGAIFNLANTIMGATLTGLPFVAKSSGIIPYLMFITVSVSMGYATLRMLIAAAAYVPDGRKDYQAVGKFAFGGLGLKVCAIGTCMSCYGALISYVVLVGTTVPTLTKLMDVSLAPWKMQIFAAVFLILPLCTLRDVSALAPASLFALLVFTLMALTSLSVFLFNDDFYRNADTRYKYGIIEDPGSIRWFPETFGLAEISKFPTIIMGFNCQYAVLPILAQLPADASREDMHRVCKGGMGSAFVVYVLHALSAYLAYQGCTKDMILLNYRHCYDKVCIDPSIPLQDCNKADIEDVCVDGNGFVTALNALFLLAVLLGYPCVHFALRKAQIALTIGIDHPFTWAAHMGFAIFNISLSLVIAMLVGGNVSKVFNWTGAVASPLLSFVLPSLFYWRIMGNLGLRVFSSRRLAGLGGIVYGLFAMGLGVTCNILVQK